MIGDCDYCLCIVEVCDLCDACEDCCLCGYCNNSKCYNSDFNATNNNYTPVGIENLCEEGYCKWCHTEEIHPNVVNTVGRHYAYCKCKEMKE